jgi:hypothetical protein
MLVGGTASGELRQTLSWERLKRAQANVPGECSVHGSGPELCWGNTSCVRNASLIIPITAGPMGRIPAETEFQDCIAEFQLPWCLRKLVLPAHARGRRIWNSHNRRRHLPLWLVHTVQGFQCITPLRVPPPVQPTGHRPLEAADRVCQVICHCRLNQFFRRISFWIVARKEGSRSAWGQRLEPDDAVIPWIALVSSTTTCRLPPHRLRLDSPSACLQKKPRIQPSYSRAVVAVQ